MVEVVTQLVIDGREASAGAEAYIRSMDAASAAAQGLVNTTKAVDDAITRGNASFQRLPGSATNAARAFDRLRNSVDPNARAQTALERAIRTTDRALAENKTTAEEAARVLDLVNQKYAQATVAVGGWAAEAQRAAQQAQRVNLSTWPGMTKGLDDVAKSTRATTFGMTNLVFQLQDVFQGVILGQRPLQLMGQQGFQMASAYEMAGGSLAGLGGALKNLISPATLASVGFVGLLAVVGPLITGLFKGAEASHAMKDATDALGASLKDVQGAFAGADDTLRRYQATSSAFAQLQINRQISTTTDALQEQVNTLADMIQSRTFTVAGYGPALVAGPTPDAAALNQLLDVARELGTGGTAALNRFETMLADMAENGTPGLQQLVDDILALKSGDEDFVSALEKTVIALVNAREASAALGAGFQTVDASAGALEETVSRLRDAYQHAGDAQYNLTKEQTAQYYTQLVTAVGQYRQQIQAENAQLTASFGNIFQSLAAGGASDAASQSLGSLINQYLFGVDSVGAFRAQLLQLDLQYGDTDDAVHQAIVGLLQQTQHLAELDRGARNAAAGLATLKAVLSGLAAQLQNKANDPAVQGAALIGDLTAQLNSLQVATGGAGGRNTYIAGLLDQVTGISDEQIARIRELGNAIYDLEHPPTGGGGPTFDFAKQIASLDTDTAKLRAQAEMLGAATGEAAAYTRQQQLLAEAQAAGIALTETQTRALAASAEEYGQATQALAEKTALRDAQFEQTQLMRSDLEQSIAEQLRQIYGDDYPNYMNGAIAAQLRLNAAIKNAQQTAAQFFDTFFTDLRNGEGLAQAAGDAVDQLSQKMQSAAIKDLLSGNFARAAIEGIISVFTFFIGRIIQARREMKQAQQDWAEMAGDVADFTATLRGEGAGGLSAALQKNIDQAQKYAEAADKAGASTDDLRQALEAFVTREVRQFIGDFGVMIDALDEGLGANSPAVQAAKNVATIGDQLRQFVADTRTAVEITGASPAAIGAAQTAAQQYALSLLGTAPELSAVEKALRTLQGTASNLQGLLEDLGMSAAEAGRAVQQGFNSALDDIRAQFSGDLQSKIYTAQGRGYLNEIGALIKEGAQLLNDAELLGVNGQGVGEYFALQAQSIVDGAQLTGSAFDDLITLFPNLAGVVHQASDAVEESIRKITDAAGTILEFLRQRLGGSQSTLSPMDRLEAARTLYQGQLSLAQGGNIDAQQNIASYASDFLDAARGMFASSEDYQKIFDAVTTALRGLPSVQQVTDPVVHAVRDSIDAILGVSTAVNDNGEATTTSVDDVASNTASALDLLEAVKGVQKSTQQTSNEISQSILNLGATTENINIAIADNYFGPMVGYLQQISDYTRQALENQAPKELKYPFLARLFPRLFGHTYKQEGGLIGYAGGGMVTNGIYNRDSVVARMAGGGQAMLSGGEFVTRATSVTPATLSVLDYINRVGRAPEHGADRQNFVDLMRVIQMVGNANVLKLHDGFARLADRLEKLERQVERQGRRQSTGSGRKKTEAA